MGSISHPSKTSYRGVLFSVFLFSVLAVANRGDAFFTSQFTLSAGEEYNDNIFLEKDKEFDFITFIRPQLTLQYVLPVAATFTPVFTFNIAPIGAIFARHSDLNDFGFGQGGGGSTAYTYAYSPRLSFHFSDVLSTQGRARYLGAYQSSWGGSLPTGSPTPGQPLSPSPTEWAGESLSVGQTVTNAFSAQARFLYSPEITITGGYQNGFTSYLDRGGNELTNSVNVRGVYQWDANHNPHAGFRLSVIKDRDGDSNFVYTFDIGDDYFSTQQIQLTPTLTLSLSTGISLNAGRHGPRVANNSNAQLIKVWETAQFVAGVQKGLTPSFGVGGISNTTSFFGNYTILFSQRLNGTADINYSMFDARTDYDTFGARAALNYWLTEWLSSSLQYRHQFNDGGSGASQTILRTGSRVHSNSVVLVFSANFDVWPNLGFGKAAPTPSLYPGLPPGASSPWPLVPPPPQITPPPAGP